MSTGMYRGSKTAMLAACGTALGCNLMIGLDDVSIDHTGAAGGSTSNSDSSTTNGGSNTTSQQGGSGGAPAATGGAGASDPTTSQGGTGGTTTSPQGGSGGTTSQGGSNETSSSGSGGATTTSTSGAGGTVGNPCGDSTLAAPEQCDDGNSDSGDGCSATCEIEPFYQCKTTSPSICTMQEMLCGDGVDNDSDSLFDFDDMDCDIPNYAPPQPCQVVEYYSSVNVPLAIPDGGGTKVSSTLIVPNDISIAHTAVILRITHPRASDVDVTLIPPFGPPRNLTSGNGGNGANYSATFLDDTCFSSILTGSAPFKACYKPETFLPSNSQNGEGIWTLEVTDHKPGQVGTLDGWAILLCGQ